MVPNSPHLNHNSNLHDIIQGLPLRKPLTLLIDVFSLVIVAIAFYRQVDVPANATSILLALLGAVNVSYFASSSYESIHGGDTRVQDQVYSAPVPYRDDGPDNV
jgi:hypothetical protein